MSTSRSCSVETDCVYCAFRKVNFFVWSANSSLSASRRFWWRPRSASSVCSRSETSPTFASSVRICEV